MKVHILEGRVRRGLEDDLVKLTACGLTIGTSETTVGRALALKCTCDEGPVGCAADCPKQQVTCKKCRKRYAPGE